MNPSQRYSKTGSRARKLFPFFDKMYPRTLKDGHIEKKYKNPPGTPLYLSFTMAKLKIRPLEKKTKK